MNVIDEILSEISVRVSDGLVDFSQAESLKVLRESLKKYNIGEPEIREVINRVVSCILPDRIAYNSEGYAIIFENSEDKLSAIGNGEVTENPPKDPTQFSYKNDDTVTKDAPKPAQQAPETKAAPEATPVPPTNPNDKASQTNLNKIDHDVDPEQRTGKETDQVDTTGPAPKAPAPAPEQNPDQNPQNVPPSMADWKHSPEETRKKATSLGWEQDDLGYWWHRGKLEGITTKRGYIMPISNGDKSKPSDWPEDTEVQSAPAPQ